MRDFPFTFNEVHNLGHKEGICGEFKKKKSCKRSSKLHHVMSIK